MFAEIIRFKKKEKECDKKTTSYLEQPSRHFCQHLMRRTTQQTFLAINWASQQKTTKLHFSSQVRKEFKLLTVPFKPLRCCLRSDNLVEFPCCPCYPLLPFVTLVTSCYPLFPLRPLLPLLPLLTLVTVVTPFFRCYPLLPLLLLFPLVTPRSPLLALFLVVTPCFPCYPLLPLVTPCYTSYPGYP